MSKEVVKNEEQKAIAEAHAMDAWGPSPVSSKDIVIPRLLLMQPGSEKVTEGEAVFGELRCSLTNKKLGDFKNAISIIPISMEKIWVEYDVETDPKKKKYLRNYPVTPSNESMPFEDKEKLDDGRTIEIARDYVMQFYVLLPDEVEKGGELPYILSFRRTGTREGKKLATQMYITNRGAKLPPPGRIVQVVPKKESTQDYTWAVPQVLLDPEVTRLTTDGELVKALEWFKLISSNKVKVDESAFEAEVQSDSDGSQPVSNESVETGPSKF